MHPDTFLPRLAAARAAAILRTKLADAVAPAMEAAVRAGFGIVEFTLTTPDVHAHLERFSARAGLIVGAGTVLSAEDAREAVRAGASFLVSPVVDPELIDEGRRLGVSVIPGCQTATEMYLAHRSGAALQKLFPAPPGGPSYVKACLGPLPFLKIVPTSGVNLSNAAEYLAAGCHAVGFVDTLFDPEELSAERFDRIEQRGRMLLAAVC